MSQKFVVFALLPVFLYCASDTLQAYRLLQYDLDGKQYGSRSAALNHYVTLAMEGSQLLGSVVVLPMWQFTDEKVKELLSGALRLAGLIVILPANDERGLLMEKQLLHQAYKAEQWMSNQLIPMPVYFTLQNSATIQLVQELQGKISGGIPPSVVTGGYKAIVKSKSPSAVKPERNFVNILGWLQAAEMVGSGDVFKRTPTIAIIANYDSWSTAPGLAYGADSNASGVAVLLQLMKMFSKIYATKETAPLNYNLLFLLTSGGYWNYAGTQHWLESRADPSLLETIDLAICLDSLGKWSTDEGVKMYYSKPGKDESTKAIYDTFQAAAEEMEVPLMQIHKKINISSESVAYQHEHFNKKRVLGITLTGKSEQNSYQPTFFDRRSTIDINALYQVTKFIGEAIARLVYTENPDQVVMFGDDSSINADTNFLSQKIDMLAMTSRFAPMNLPLKEGIVPTLKNVFEKYLKSVKIDQFSMDRRVKLFDTVSLELKIVNTSGVLFDVFLLFGIFLILLGLFASVRVYLFGFEELRRDITVLFQPQLKKGGKRR